MPPAPETPAPGTLIERAATALHVPFPVLAGLLAFALSAAVPQTIIPGTGSSGGALGGLLTTNADLILGKVILFGLFFYVILIRRAIRIRALAVGADLPHHQQNPQAYFRDLSVRSYGVRWPLVATVVATVGLTGAILLEVPTSSSLYSWDQLPLYLFFTFWRILALSLAVYTFAVVSWGMYEYARRPLEMESYFDDPALGLSPLGAFTISLVVYYVILIALLSLWGSLSSNGEFVFALVVILSLVGVVLFLQPMRAFHTKMVAEKERALEQVGARMRIELQRVDLTGQGTGTADPANILALEAIERRVEAIRTWPFPTGAAESLFGQLIFPIVLSILAGVLLNGILS